MIRGIAIFGHNGAGKSTLTHALAKEIGCFEMDVEDYYFPEQKASRLHHKDPFEGLPFAHPRSKSEVQSKILEDIQAHPSFILSGVTMNWSDELLSHIDIAFWVQTPLEERLKRIQTREEKRFGARVLEGGDMFAQQMAFRHFVENRDQNAVEESASRLVCPVIVMDGTLSWRHNLEIMMDAIKGEGKSFK